MAEQEPIKKIPNLLQAQSRISSPLRQLPASPPGRSSGPAGFFSKLLVFDALAVLLAAALGYYTLLQFAGRANFLILLGIASLFFLASFFDFLLAQERRRRALSMSLQILAFLGFFYGVGWGVFFSALLVLLVFYWLAVRSGALLADNIVKFRLGAVARAYIKKIFIGFALAIIILYLPQGSTSNVFVSRERFQQWYNAAAGLSQKLDLNIELGSSVGEFAEDIARARLTTNSDYRQLPEDLREKAVQNTVDEMISNTEENIGFELTREMPLSEAFYQYLLGLFSRFREQFGQSFVAVYAAALFAVAWSLGTIFVWFTVVIAFLIYEALAAMNVVHLTGETRTKETVELT